VAHAVGRESTELVLLYNRINLEVEIGELERADAAIAGLALRAERAGLRHFVPALALIESEIALVTGDLARAQRTLEVAAAGFAELGLEREGLEVEIGWAELELGRGEPELARQRALAAEERAGALAAEDLALRAELALARAARRRGDVSGLNRVEGALARAQRAGQELLAARLATEHALLAEACGVPRALEQIESARRHWDRLAANLPEASRQRFWADPRRSALVRFTRLESAGRTSHEAALRKLVSLSRRINSSLSRARVLEYAVEAAIELCSAERGFLLLRETDGAVKLETARADDALARPSQSIVQRVLASGEPLLTTDAESDARLAGSGSVHAQRLKAVLCVPVATPAETMGALYVDSRLSRARFGDVERDVLLALADHVAVALANARLHSALEQRTSELEAEKRLVERLSADKDRELGRLRERVEAQRRTLELRYDYSQIAGRGTGMRRVLGELDRIIDSDASVLIQGESGTGKELIARAIHVHGTRKDAAFVGINCASIPETLLESELFGHVRGAFTGAQRDKQGLLLTAHGGTLFLDELAELSLTTQAKLLRVLQEREVRPLGADKARPIDVRLVCATHRQLAREVEAGRFRQDLFYRVAVMEVRLPPLRERIEDLPEIARVILERMAKTAGRPRAELAPDALRALAAYPFPGNVRELENILTRAFVLSEGARIGAADLGLGGAPARARRSRTRAEFEAEERERILEALRSARWNVSVVSRTLGIPRNTLYRKLDRYGLRRDPGASHS
jgi:transcriptional regulator with GAF, ATPase, and Fis domain